MQCDADGHGGEAGEMVQRVEEHTGRRLGRPRRRHNSV